MAITYVGGVQGGRAGATTTTTQSISGTLTGGSNTSPSQGDLIVVLCSAGADTTAAPDQTISGNTSGAYQNEALQSQLGSTYDAYSQLNWQFAGATPDTTLTIPSSGSARNAQRWIVHVFRGVNSTTPRDVTSTVATGTATGRPDPPSIEPVTPGAWILWLGASAAGTGAAYTAPTDFATDWLGGTTADTADVMQGAGYYTGWTSGAYNPAAITAGGTTGAADAWVATTAALRPAQPTITGTATATIGEADVVAGGKTIIITLNNDTWVAAGATFDAQRSNILQGLDSAQAEATGWNAVVRDAEVVGAVVRTSDTVVTITLSAAATYDITAQETITVTVPSTAVTAAIAYTGTPTFTVDITPVGHVGGLAGAGGLAGPTKGLAG